jgi:hypothetical protein
MCSRSYRVRLAMDESVGSFRGFLEMKVALMPLKVPCVRRYGGATR